jgi:hypothetical protein
MNPFLPIHQRPQQGCSPASSVSLWLRLQTRVCALVFIAASIVCSAPATAGPTDTDVEPPAKGAAANTGSSRSSRADGTPGNAVNSGGTLDVLIDLQGKSSVGLDFRNKAKGAPTDRPLSGAEAAPTTGGLYGAGAAPAIAAPRKANPDDYQPVADQRIDPNAPVVGDSSRRPSGAVETVEVEPGVAAKFLAWVRENRAVVIMAALVLLALVGVVSAGGAAGRRGR